MKVILTDDVAKLGAKNTIVEVSDGYARNFLIPRGLAIPATKGAVRGLEKQRGAMERRQERLKKQAGNVAERLAQTPLRVTARVGETGRLFGSVTTQLLAAALKEQFGVEVDRHRIELTEPIKTVGTYTVTVLLPGNVHAKVTVEVVPEGEVLTDAETAATA
ncbi:MAG: 50S ribosomal protein L9 [Abditibacteriales bacterium]|nr:50S ribosomal protein L9 [Abditibacteriales bacterium]MDW8366360.1 50S ribosomal protein L9 [Abditibacteriales bacterium]